MLSIYTRHRPPCKRTDIHYRRCHCPKWIRGRLEDSGLIRRSARTRSWAEAERKARDLERRPDKAATIESAVAAYLNDEEARKLKPATLWQKRAFIQGTLLRWCNEHALRNLEQLRLPQLRELRHTWDVAPNTAGRRHERLRSFFAFCVANGWLDTNPTDHLKKPVIPRTLPTDYFTQRQFHRVVAATEEYEYRGGLDWWHRGHRMRTLVLLMRWSGLAITDAVTLARHRVDESGALFLRRAKTGVPVFVPLPPAVTSLLRALPSVNPSYFFWRGNGKPQSAVQGYQRSFRIADIRNPDGTRKRCHSHMFRDTFAVEPLLAGVPIDQVSVLLGHRSIKMTEKHYLPWVKARQRQLTASVRHAWFREVRQSPSRQQREAEDMQNISRPWTEKCRSFELHVCVSRPVVHPFLLCL
jgi:integrase/recombinase XerD